MNTDVNAKGHSGMAVMVYCAVAAMIAMGFSEWRVRSVERELSVSPRIAVIPVYAMIQSGIEDKGLSSEEAVQLPVAAAKRLADQGFIVLDADRVYAYPEQLEVRP